MKLLADENVDQPIVRWLREQGHDVVWVAERSPGLADDDVLALAQANDRVLITFDHDFGERIFRRGARAPGVLLMRLRASTSTELVAAVASIWPDAARQLPGHFVVVTDRKLRIRRLDTGGAGPAQP